MVAISLHVFDDVFRWLILYNAHCASVAETFSAKGLNFTLTQFTESFYDSVL